MLFFICEMYFICANHREINTHLNNKQVKLRSSIVIEKVKVKKLVNVQVVTGGKFYNNQNLPPSHWTLFSVKTYLEILGKTN